MNADVTTDVRWKVSARVAGEVLTARLGDADVEILVLGVPEGFSRAEVEGWLGDILGVARESRRADAGGRAIPPLLHHALSGLVFSHAELWSLAGATDVCSCVFLLDGDQLGFGWVGHAEPRIEIDGREVEAGWTRVRDDEGREASGLGLPAAHRVRISIRWGREEARSADIEAVWPGVAPGAAAPREARLAPRLTAEDVQTEHGARAGAGAGWGPDAPEPVAGEIPPLRRAAADWAPRAETHPAPDHEVLAEADRARREFAGDLVAPFAAAGAPSAAPVPDADERWPGETADSPWSGEAADAPWPGKTTDASWPREEAAPQGGAAPGEERFEAESEAPDEVDTGAWGGEPQGGGAGPAAPAAPAAVPPAEGWTTVMDAEVSAHEPEQSREHRKRGFLSWVAGLMGRARPGEGAHGAPARAPAPEPAAEAEPRPVSAAAAAEPAGAESPPPVAGRAEPDPGGLLGGPSPRRETADEATVEAGSPPEWSRGAASTAPATTPTAPTIARIPPAAFRGPEPARPTTDAPPPTPSPEWPVEPPLSPPAAPQAAPVAAADDGPEPSAAVRPTARVGSSPPRMAPPARSGDAPLVVEDVTDFEQVVDPHAAPALPALPRPPRTGPPVWRAGSDAAPAPPARASAPPALEAHAATGGAPGSAPAAPALDVPAAAGGLPGIAPTAPALDAPAPTDAAPGIAPAAEPVAWPAWTRPPAEPPAAPPVAREARASASPPPAPAARPTLQPEWPEPVASDEEVRRPLWARPWAWAIAALALLAGGWLVGSLQDERPAGAPGPVTRAARALGLGGARFEVHVQSRPPGAWIALGGRDLARRTPAVVDLPPGEHQLTLSFSDLGSASFTVLGERGDRLSLDAPLWGGIEIRDAGGDLPVAVSVDGRSLGFAPVRLDSVLPGPHEVRFSGPGMPSWGSAVTVRVNEVATLVARPMTSPATGLLEVRAMIAGEEAGDLAGAAVWVDGERRGVTPLTLELPRGPHSIRVEHQGERAPVQVIDLPGGNQRFATFEFGVSGERPALEPVDPPARIPLDAPTVISGALRGVSSTEVREMWLHVRTPDGTWRRVQMTMMKASGGVVGVAVYPPTLFDEQGRARWYVSASTQTGDEYFTEIVTSQAEAPPRR